MPTNLFAAKKYDAVIVVGPSHRVAFHGVSVFSRGGYETPLGVVPVEETLAGKIKKINKAVMEIPQAHLQEHSVEIQLPFLQVALGEFSFVPLVMGDQDANTCRELAGAIYEASLGKKYWSWQFRSVAFYNDTVARKMDAVALDYLKTAMCRDFCAVWNMATSKPAAAVRWLW